MIFNITPTRNFNVLYIILDSIFILVFLVLLIVKKRYMTTIFALFGGILYFLVDYGYFYLLSHSRQVLIQGVVQNSTMTGWILFWMSMSYGITNFAFIWLCLRKDKDLKNWLMLIVGWWLIVPLIATLGKENTIQTFRTTNQYHSYMAIVLGVGYGGLLIYNLLTKKKQISLLWLNFIGIMGQFSWEFSLLLHGIRPLNENSLSTL